MSGSILGWTQILDHQLEAVNEMREKRNLSISFSALPREKLWKSLHTAAMCETLYAIPKIGHPKIGGLGK